MVNVHGWYVRFLSISISGGVTKELVRRVKVGMVGGFK